MCSVGDDGVEGERHMEGNAPMPEITDAKCNKCKGPTDLVLRRKDFYCNACFSEAVEHKFKASFGKSKMVKPGADILAAHSGSVNSSVLIHLLSQCFKEGVHKKTKLNPMVVYIDDGLLFNKTLDERRTFTDSIKSKVDSYKFPLYVITLGRIMDPSPISNLTDELIIDESSDAILSDLFKMKDVSTRHDLLKKLKRNLLIRVAETLNCSFVLYADISQDLAVDSLINVSLGGGRHMANDIGFSDDRDSIKILRPMREITLEELNNYVKLQCIQSLDKRSLSDLNNPYASIQSRIHHFVADLEVNFPATVSTVLRTSSKMENVISAENEQCLFCQSALDNEAGECSALQATSFSREMSTLSRDFSKSCLNGMSPECPETNCCSSTSNENDCTDVNTADFLCHRCNVIFKNVKDKNVLQLREKALTRKNRLSMKDAIKDFLIE